MGVRFACHACGKRLNIKTELAGKRGICPACSVRFRIPPYDTEVSTPLESAAIESAGVDAGADERASGTKQGYGSQSRPANASMSHSTASERFVAVQDLGNVAVQDSPQAQAVANPEPTVAAPATSGTSLRDVLGDASATWYVRPPNGGQYGPADGPTMGQWLKEGRVADLAMVWRDGWTDWRLAKDAILRVVPTQNDQKTGISPGISSGDPGTPPASAFPSQSIENQPVGQFPTANQRVGDQVVGDQAIGDQRTGLELTPRSGPLGSNKQKRSRKRVVASITLGLVFIGLIGALVFVLTRS